MGIDDDTFSITQEMVTVKRYPKTIHVEEFVPSVVEPSFGVGRIMYGVFEHTYRRREDDDQRTYLALPPVLAPYKCSILPLSGKPELKPFVSRLSTLLTSCKLSHKVDNSSGSIGRRYARTDQISIPYGITVDFDTIKDVENPTVTLRDRDSMEQVRLPMNEVATVIQGLVANELSWEIVTKRFP